VRPGFNVPPVQPGDGIGESSFAGGIIAPVPAVDVGIIADAPPIIGVIAGAPPVAGVICGIMFVLGDVGIALLGAFVPAVLAVIELDVPADVPAAGVAGGIAVLPATPAGAAAVGGWIAGSIFETLSPPQAAQARAIPSEAPSRKPRAHCTWSSITPLLW
jgi:hypothetical protein